MKNPYFKSILIISGVAILLLWNFSRAPAPEESVGVPIGIPINNRLSVLLGKLNSGQPMEWNEAQELVREVDRQIKVRGKVEISQVAVLREDPTLLKKIGQALRP